MPVSLNPMDATTERNNATNVIRKRLKSTNKMVDDALIELHTTKGVTLKQIYNFILTNYNITSLTRNRMHLIKKYLISLRESEEIYNTTGKGMNGHFKLVDKKNFIDKITNNEKKAREMRNAIRKAKTVNKVNKSNQSVDESKTKPNIKRIIKKPSIYSQYPEPIIPRQLTPVALRHINVSMFDTPMISSQVHASTPFISTGFVPRAPEINRRVNRKKPVQEVSETPRTSLPGKKRRLLNRIE